MNGNTQLQSAPDKFQVHQHWDPLKICAVGRSYPPEFYSWIKDCKTRQIFEKLAIQTEEDFQLLINKLERFGVEVWRPDIAPEYQEFDMVRNQYREPPMTPRDDMVMIGSKFYRRNRRSWNDFYAAVRANNWPESAGSIFDLPVALQTECRQHGWDNIVFSDWDPYKKIIEKLQGNSNQTFLSPHDCINGSSVARLGKDIVIGWETPLSQKEDNAVRNAFGDLILHITQSDGHADGGYCPVCPGLIISHHDSAYYQSIFPDWQVVEVLPSLHTTPKWQKHRHLTRGRWWLSEFDVDQDVIDVVHQHLDNFVGLVDETAFEVNMLIIDPKNVIAFSYNKIVETALNQFGITLHVVPFRHRYFWDGGAHCVTLDVHRDGTQQKIL